MRTLYLDCGMGAAGDMLTAALMELLPDPEKFLRELNALGIPGVRYTRETAVKCGITGTRISVYVNGAMEGERKSGQSGGQSHEDGHHHEGEHHHEHSGQHSHSYETSRGQQGARRHLHRTLGDVRKIVKDLHLPEQVEADVLAVYRSVAQAESAAHGVDVEEIHFHEVGSRDAIADVTAVCLLLDRLAPDEIIASPVHVGSGQVRTAHGILPVPAPATAWLLRGVPVYGGSVDGELCTPTGAALLRHFVSRFGDMPVMNVESIGYGMGKKDFERANCVRALWGETPDRTDQLLQLSCNVDDMSPEEVSFATERLFANGAREVFTIPVGMKKSRTGLLVRVLCTQEDREKMLRVLFQHTTTIGVREEIVRRYTLERKEETLQTPFGEVRRKRSKGYGVSRVKYEYEDLARIARERDISIPDVRALLDNL